GQVLDQVRHIQMRASVRRDRSGKPAVVSGTSQDVTDSYKIEELEREKQIAIRSAQIRQEFLAKTSHEIRTPLNPVLMLTQRLLNTELTTDQREQLETIKSAGETLLAVVNDILDLSKIEAGKIDFYHEPFQLSKTFSHIRDMQEQFAGSRGLQFQMDVDERIPRVLVGDGVRLSQILMNLINNAVKNTTKGSIRVRAEMVKTEDSWVEIAFTVKDTGIGIPKDQLDSIFEIFLQIDSDLNRRYKGSGLGLTIVNQLVTLQGGRIEVDSEPNVGSTFTAYLRYEIGSEKADPKNGEGHHSFDLKGLNILLIEDNPLNQMVTQKLLNDYGVMLDIANNGQEGVEMVQEGSYDLVLMDVQMPVMDGYEATRFIRKLGEPLCKIPIIALTANAFTGSDDECLKAGMDDYVSKPIETSTFLDKIAAHARRSTSNGNGKHEDATHVNGSLNGSAVSYPEINPSSPMTAPPYSDLDYLKGICAGDHSLMRKAIDKFLDSLPTVIEQLRNYIRDNNFTELSKAAHKFKSSAAVMGIHEVKDAMLRMEVIAKEPTLKGELPALMERVEFVLKHAEGELRGSL
ncbi:MAG: response regulator, partial [Bacteroidetes bacterium]